MFLTRPRSHLRGLHAALSRRTRASGPHRARLRSASFNVGAKRLGETLQAAGTPGQGRQLTARPRWSPPSTACSTRWLPACARK